MTSGERKYILALCLVAGLLLSACTRRQLWVYTDEYRQVELFTDWEEAEAVPDGMTAVFMNENLSGQYRQITTAEIQHTWLNLPNGTFTGVVFDWSPSEYGRQAFLGLSRPDSIRVQARDAYHALNEVLYGPDAVPDGMPVRWDATLDEFVVSQIPEPMNADTLHHVVIDTGVEGDLIPWEQKDSYGNTLTIYALYAYPKPIIWRVHVLVYVRGIMYMDSMQASLAGLADGIMLSDLRHTASPCLHALDDWESRRTLEEVGTVSTTICSFGLPGTGGADLPPLRLNLQFLLRDLETRVNYHYDLTENEVTVFPDDRVIRIEIPIDYPCPDLPYVDAKGSAGFDADVTPWVDGGNANVTM